VTRKVGYGRRKRLYKGRVTGEIYGKNIIWMGFEREYLRKLERNWQKWKSVSLKEKS